MKPPDAAILLDVWERGLQKSLQQKAFGLLQAACADVDKEQLLRLSIGERDAALLDLRGWLFGNDLEITTSCASCGEQLEARLDIDALRMEPAGSASRAETMQFEGFSLHFRLPEVADLLSVTGWHDEAEVRKSLICACLLEAHGGDGHAVSPLSLSDGALQAVSQRMAQLDPQADMVLAFSCPHCEAEFGHVFDIVSVLVKEVHNWAQRMLRDIHALACAYGWSEQCILALGPLRRQAYLDMVRP
jgi:hypothetical protein